jgi:DNA-binding GntR family transcriptional regulator
MVRGEVAGVDEPASAVTPLDLSDRRLAASAAHDRIRGLILSGQLPAGTVISQVDLAADLGISRTPLREALRMLQEEGLVEAEPNRRSRVAAFSAAEMDAIYGIRLLLEALGMRLTLAALPPDAIEQAGLLLDELEELGGPAAGAAWHRVHHAFHETFVAGATDPLFDQIVSYAQRSERYMYQEAHAGLTLSRGRPAEHRQILQLVQARDYDAAVITAARHLARTPMLILAELAADTEPANIRGALSMISSMGATPGRSEERAERKPRRTTA